MIIKNIVDRAAFFKAVDQCRGKVELITSEGDRLNLKSKLSQYVSLTSIFTEAMIDRIEVITELDEDMEILIEHLVRGV